MIASLFSVNNDRGAGPDLNKTQTVSYGDVAAVVMLTWDIIVTMSDEVEHIWVKRWTAVKVMYLVSRYFPWTFQLALLTLSSNGSTGAFFTAEQCSKWVAMQAMMLQTIVTVVDIILIIRVYALYNKSRMLLTCIVILFAAEVTVLCYVLAEVVPKLRYNSTCFVISSPRLFIVYWITSLVFESILFLLVLGHFLLAVVHGWSQGRTVQQFISDGTWAYAVIFATMLVNAIFYDYVHSPLAGFYFTWLLSVLSFAGSRLILNPRRHDACGHRMPSTANDVDIGDVSALCSDCT
ncbi:hypothetical protein OBBRIDRAFT_109255 [Obba rivulosa]|uniref:DUF6533 domain-containing protein n=1 Tax=Obba rivulosa TaxID=1052685 RepID=A0A8E2AWV6_9APHY|nr:hypothetical protein OBBRIDRAFT_109255 [Obba rivulosa]